MKLFKTRSLTGLWWVRTSVSEEPLCAPSLTRFPRRGAIKRSRGGWRGIFLPLQNKWVITVLRARSAPRLVETGGFLSRNSGAKVSIILSPTVIPSRRQSEAQWCPQKKRKSPLLQNKLWPAGVRVPPTVYNSFIPKDSGVCGSLRESRAHSLPLLLSGYERFQPLIGDMNRTN